VVTAVVAFTTPTAAAADGIGVEARAGFGVSSMLSDWQREQGYQSGFVPDLRPGLRLGASIATELALASWSFPRSSAGTGRATFLGAGLRWDPRLRTWLTWFFDAHGGIALTGPANRFMLDLGAGFDIWVTDNLGLGPFLRHGQIIGQGVDPRFWAAGLGVTMTWPSAGDDTAAPERAERQRSWQVAREHEKQALAQRDVDFDGVTDDVDACPDQPAGSRPDPNLPGCPRGERRLVTQVQARPAQADSDRDGVPDREDRCPDRPFGKYPDPLSMGCPLLDGDHDGIPDVLDACPTKRGKPSSRERQNGCAPGGSLPRSRPVLSCGSEASA
jgi:hypothetical protein